MENSTAKDLHALVDMGSNGIRFSISDLSHPTTRIIPTVYQDRAGISLFDAQFKPGSDTRQSIPEDVQKQVISHLLRFKETCLDFGVPESRVTVLATEATRLAPNSTDFRQKIKDSTNWEVQMLSKEEEGSVGAWGIASSLADVEGLVMDLGGGSTQLTWMVTKDGEVRSSEKGSMSFPYGAAALTRRLEKAKEGGQDGLKELQREMLSAFQNGYRELGVPADLIQRAETRGGINLYLSGGGFRGWGYLLMNRSSVDTYPIPIINGFKAQTKSFQDTSSVTKVLSTSESNVFRVSERRASQIPAVAFLVNVLTLALPLVKEIRFCQGGVREGFFFKTFLSTTRAQDPLVSATTPYRTSSHAELSSILQSCLPTKPEPKSGISLPLSFTPDFVTALSNIMYAHSTVPKDARPASALHSTTTGILAYAHGLSHEQRALLALTLYERWSGDLSPSDENLRVGLRQIVSMEEAWWSKYLGCVAGLLGDVYPAGVIRDGATRKISFEANLEATARPKKGGFKRVLRLIIGIPGEKHPSGFREFVQEESRRIEKVGKKKNWIKANERVESSDVVADWGIKVDVAITMIS